MIGVDEVEAVRKLSMKDPMLGKTMSKSGTMEGTPSSTPSMKGCNSKSGSSSGVRSPYVIWCSAVVERSLKRKLKKENLQKHVGVCRRVGWDGWNEWAPQWGKDMAGVRGREGLARAKVLPGMGCFFCNRRVRFSN